ncbi:hypothetical protein QBC38DRAFT_445204 [Podospora fimiseda]|uniref:Uncharacterized protein n=1 Tax=Podospora fimiseda TaxID=252190 RepID=A0AAN7BLZ6_9PEZI|nr:hypothetical protein QBC38DRAFT_445204 [Podospora fimiseda]
MPPSLDDEKELLLAAEQGEMSLDKKKRSEEPPYLFRLIAIFVIGGLVIGLTRPPALLYSVPEITSQPLTPVQYQCMDICRNDMNHNVINDHIDIFVAEAHPYTIAIQHSTLQQQEVQHSQIKKRGLETESGDDETIKDDDIFAPRRSEIEEAIKRTESHPLTYSLSRMLSHNQTPIPEDPKQWKKWYQESMRRVDSVLADTRSSYKAQLRLTTLNKYDTIRNTDKDAGPGYVHQVVDIHPFSWLDYLKDDNRDFLSKENLDPIRIDAENARIMSEIAKFLEEAGLEFESDSDYDSDDEQVTILKRDLDNDDGPSPPRETPWWMEAGYITEPDVSNWSSKWITGEKCGPYDPPCPRPFPRPSPSPSPESQSSSSSSDKPTPSKTFGREWYPGIPLRASDDIPTTFQKRALPPPPPTASHYPTKTLQTRSYVHSVPTQNVNSLPTRYIPIPTQPDSPNVILPVISEQGDPNHPVAPKHFRRPAKKPLGNENRPFIDMYDKNLPWFDRNTRWDALMKEDRPRKPEDYMINPLPFPKKDGKKLRYHDGELGGSRPVRARPVGGGYRGGGQ